MSFTKLFAATTAILLSSPMAWAGAAGGGTELPSNAEPNKAKGPGEKNVDKGSSVERGGSMEKGGMEKGEDMKKQQ